MRSTLPGAESRTVLRVMLVELRCVLATLLLLVRHRLELCDGLVGAKISFGDGSTSRVYRETVMRGATDTPEVVLAVRFRLRLIETSRFWHALFRFESLFNTLLFAAHPGFHTKLWLTDLETGHYRGIYEWQDAPSAVEYLETLRVVLRPWVETDSFDYRVLESSRDAYLGGLLADERHTTSDVPWWLPVTSEGATVG